jgi:solute carrier family 35 protein F1/2
MVLGDIYCILGATFYAFSNVTEEYFVRKRPLYEVVGQMGLFGSIISAIQL